ncbi:seryl-tRNA synthetase [Bacillus mesophilus]|uniref:Serine--tRNA ligase n=1 Tax=Bacillus mesophilus TaxID=1808955 RepID=A0A6M0Q9N5_9BACI|nr:serine--tRNA ligase [Bacillus mesophilus]MBM7662286.1 seryl-tRNA synthetase [Bacillus mesophilus]NEY73081.1 serine--tRNA ligase [Bacillus mesophilus]
MLDINVIRENKEVLKTIASHKGINVPIDQLIEVDVKRRRLIQEIETIRAKKNTYIKEIKTYITSNNQNLINEAKENVRKINMDITERELKLKDIKDSFDKLMLLVPNFLSPDTPIGTSDEDNRILKIYGEVPHFSYEMKSHVDLGTELGIFDFERGVKVAGSRSYFLKNTGFMLNRAVQQLTIDLLLNKGFDLMEVPLIVNKDMFTNTGFFPVGEDQSFHINDSNKYLVGTSEVPLISYYSNEIIEQPLPIKLASSSSCFRSEVGSAGRDVKGLYRVHQFSKVEQVVLCENNVDVSNKILVEITETAEEVLQLLELPYRIVQVCSKEMGQGVYKKFDIETWMPSRNSYGETHSASNLLDFQSRRSNIRYKDNQGVLKYFHTLNCTAIASPRILIPLLEVHQQEDGSVYIPKALRKYLHNTDYLRQKENSTHC